MRCNYPQGIAPVTSTVFHAASQSGRTCSRISRFSLVFPRVGESTVKALAPCPVCLLPESDAASMLSPLAVSTRSGWNSMRLFLCEKPSQGKRSEEHTSELQSLMRISYAVFCLKKKQNDNRIHNT